MKKMIVSLTVQTEINYDEMEDGAYEEKLEELLSELDDLGLQFTVESEELADDDDEDYEEEI